MNMSANNSVVNPRICQYAPRRHGLLHTRYLVPGTTDVRRVSHTSLELHSCVATSAPQLYAVPQYRLGVFEREHRFFCVSVLSVSIYTALRSAGGIHRPLLLLWNEKKTKLCEADRDSRLTAGAN